MKIAFYNQYHLCINFSEIGCCKSWTNRDWWRQVAAPIKLINELTAVLVTILTYRWQHHAMATDVRYGNLSSK